MDSVPILNSLDDNSIDKDMIDVQELTAKCRRLEAENLELRRKCVALKYLMDLDQILRDSAVMVKVDALMKRNKFLEDEFLKCTIKLQQLQGGRKEVEAGVKRCARKSWFRIKCYVL